MNLSFSASLKMAELLEAAGKEQDWDNEGLVDGFSTAREFRKLKDLTINVAKVLRKSAIPSAAFGVKFTAKIFGDITQSKSFHNSRFAFLWSMLKHKWTSRS